MQQSLLVESDVELRQEWVPFTRDHHVLIAIQSHAYLAPGLGRGQGGQRGNYRSLCFFPAKSPSHARTFDNDTMHGQRQHMRDDVLHFGWMLRR